MTNKISEDLKNKDASSDLNIFGKYIVNCLDGL
jgi:hypothetical protein